MCDRNSLQLHIRRLTNNGEVVARFLTDTVQGKTPGAKACHQVKAMEYLVRFGLTDKPEKEEDKFWGLLPTPEELAERQDPPTENSKLKTQNSPVTYLDILNYELARLIRSETAEGHTIAEFLYHVMTGRDKPFTPKRLRIKPADRMTAAMEIIRRGYGHFGRRRKLVDDPEEANDYDRLHSDLAKRLRQYGERGSQAILFLHDVMRNNFPEEQFTMRHRVSAAQELSRRGWDTGYDSIKTERLMDYWRDQQDARLSVGQKKRLAGLHAFAEDYDAYDAKDYDPIAKELREWQDRESDSIRLSPENGKPEARGESPTHPVNPVSPTENSQLTTDNSELETENSILNTDNSELTTQDSPNCYYEPLKPEDQALFDYYNLIESGEYKEGEIQPQPVTEAMRLAYEATLKWMRDLAEAEGVPLLPNPLSGAFKRPNARSP